MECETRYTFAAFRLDDATQLLWENEKCIKLPPKTYQLLLYFLQHPGRLISHDELLNGVWGGRIVENSALRLTVNCLRHALRDNSKSPRFISTDFKRGYRFLVEVFVSVPGQEKYGLLPYQSLEKGFSIIKQPKVDLTVLFDAWQQAENGQRSLVFLSGPQNSGKTSMIENFLSQIQGDNLAVLNTRCVRLGSAVEPFLPLLEALEGHCKAPYGKSLKAHMYRFAPSWLGQMLGVLDQEELADLMKKMAFPQSRSQLREGADFFEVLGIHSRFVLILDNAQWSDEYTLDLLNFLMFRSSFSKLLIIISYRVVDEDFCVGRIIQMQAELSRRGLCKSLKIGGENSFSTDCKQTDKEEAFS